MSHGARAIELRGVRVHNLKGVDLNIPLKTLVVFSGVSGSGKSSLAFDTLYAEGQMRYIETFSAESRQFLERLDKPDADRIDNIPPAIAVSQRFGPRSSRSTVGTVTEIHDHLALLYARAGEAHCARCGSPVRPSDPSTVVQAIEQLPEGTRYLIGYPIDVRPETDLDALANLLREDGLTRVRVGSRVVRIESGPSPVPGPGESGPDGILDRMTRGAEAPARRMDSIETAFMKGLGRCRILVEGDSPAEWTFLRGRRCTNCGAEAPEPDPRLFRYNSPLGACPTCEGTGRVVDLDLSLIVPDPSRSIKDGAIAPWNTPGYSAHLQALLDVAKDLDLPTEIPFKRLKPEQVALILEGHPGTGYPGLRATFRTLESKTHRASIRSYLNRWRGTSPCPACRGARLRPESLAVRFAGLSIDELSRRAISQVGPFLESALETVPNPVAGRVIEQLRSRLAYLSSIGLDYLTLDRPARTLSAGESRRLSLTTALGSGLVNTLYVLDEPSIGLHPRDVGRLVDVLKRLRDAGNSVVVVEHERAIIQAADRLVDIGPGAGESGGRLLYEGPPSGILPLKGSATADILAGRKRVLVPQRRRTPKAFLHLKGASGHNLKSIDVDFPIGVLCVVTGVSGAGKSTLVEETLYPALRRRLKNENLPAAPFRELIGTGELDDAVMVDASPIGRSGRSNPVTYLKAFDEIRRTFAATHEARLRNYGASKFSFNVEGGRCDACEGNGSLTIDMQFLADVIIKCPECKGTRYRPEVLEITYRGKSIADVLDLTAREAFGFFKNRPKVQARLRPLIDVGLDYLRLGQPASTLSGGEAQRLKLADFLASSPAAIQRASQGPRTLFLLDEPTTGLHPADTLRLLDALTSLLDLGHTVLVIEHAPELLAAADWIIDLGPEAGEGGGRVVATGTPEDVARSGSHTGRVLAEILAQNAAPIPHES